MATKKKMLQAAAGSAAGGGFTAIEDVFSTYLYTGNGSTQTITNDIDLAGEGGLVWLKHRSGAPANQNHNLVDTLRGINAPIFTNTTGAQLIQDTIASFNSDGFSLGPFGPNALPTPYASWTFRKAPRFFDVVTYTGTGAARTIAHNLGTTVGSIIIKRTDTTSNWAVYHRGNTAAPETDYLSLNLTNATADDATFWNDTAPTDSVFTVGTNAAVNASGGTYVAYLYAHDPLGPSGDGSDGLISCGSYTGTGASNNKITLGWEPQWLLIKCASTARNWLMYDNMRGLVNNGNDAVLFPDLSSAESPSGYILDPLSDGFSVGGTDLEVNGSGQTYTYIAIRRGPMRVPTSGTEVFKPSYGLNASNSEIVNAGFPIDLNWRENVTGGYNVFLQDRMRGFDNFLSSNNTSAEGGAGGTYSGTQNGIRLAATLNFSSWINWSFRRAPNFFDVVAYTGNDTYNRTLGHNLTVAPEMIVLKARNRVDNWIVYHKDIGTGKCIYLNSNSVISVDGSFPTTPTNSIFYLGAGYQDNGSAYNYIAYLFATLAGVSKVGSYTGNGTSQTINCGFTTGARFILIKRTDSTGDWYVWDTARGIVAGNDPHLSLNTTAAEVTTDDSIDPASSGFIVNQLAATNINVSAASYIFYAVA